MRRVLAVLFLTAAVTLPAAAQPPRTPRQERELRETIETVNRIAAGPEPSPVADALGVLPNWAWALSAVPAIYVLRRLHQMTNPPEEKR